MSTKLTTAILGVDVERALKSVEPWIPHQGPIGVFIHQNTLGGFEHRPFEEAVEAVSEVLGSEPYMTHSWYLQQVAAHRINTCDLSGALTAVGGGALSMPKVGAYNAQEVCAASLYVPRLKAPDATIRTIAEREVAVSEQGLWSQVARETKALRDAQTASDGRALSQAFDPPLHAVLVPLAAAFLDRGVAFCPMPQRSQGFFAAVRSLLLGGSAVLKPTGVVKRLLTESKDGMQALLGALGKLQVGRADLDRYLLREAIALPGWAGTFATLSHGPPGAHPVSFVDFMAVRLILKLAMPGDDTKAAATPPRAHNETLWIVREMFHVLRRLGSSQDRVASMDLGALWRLLEAFGDVARRRTLHRAYEQHYARIYLGSLKSHTASRKGAILSPARVPDHQIVFCIDEREESTRRHLEESLPSCDTYGVAGFFGVDMAFKSDSVTEAHPHCPAPVTPKHVVSEPERRRPGSALRTRASRFLHECSRGVISGVVLASPVGLAAAIPLASRVLLPHLGPGEKIRLAPDVQFEYVGQTSPEGLRCGYTVDEMADRIQAILEMIGLVGPFAPVITFLGHGSTSVNNPFKSAYDCGACGGRRGAANARIFARMANIPGVRAELAKRGLPLTDKTWFVGGYHDTATDLTQLFDLDHVPAAFASRVENLQKTLEKVRGLAAAERVRRFHGAGDLGPIKALKHVVARSKDMREARPEYGHATNAALMVGRRSLTRGLFLDRRTFMSSYDYRIDPDGKLLARHLGAVIPVCSGINLEYFFSCVDNERYGSGTKLPHNLVGMIGLMNGATSDLRTGLPSQMVEIHEPMRILIIVDAPTPTVDAALAMLPLVRRTIDNRWVKFYVREPHTGEFFMPDNGGWTRVEIDAVTLPQAARSLDYARGAAHLSPARVLGGVEA